MSEKFIESFVKMLQENGIAKPYEIKGCSVDEINKLEEYTKLKLPSIYKDFLMALGHGAGNFWKGTDFRYHSLFDFREEAINDVLSKEEDYFKLKDNYFIFVKHQGYLLWYFEIDGNNDPPIYLYKEYDKDSSKVSSSFSEYLFESLKPYLK